MILALLDVKLQLTPHPDGGNFGFCQYGCHMMCPSWRPPKIQSVLHWWPLGQIWCFWKNL